MSTIAQLSDIIAPARHLFLSPHYDDIALSCGGTASLIADNDRSSEICLIFGDIPDPSIPLTPFASEMHERWGLDAQAVIDSRRAEEAAASEILGTSDIFLPFLDAIYRGHRYLSDDDLFGQMREDESPVADAIIEQLDMPSGSGKGRFYAPMGVGNHVDHQHAFNAGMRLVSLGQEVLFYEDLPYALIPGKLEERLEATAFDRSNPVLVDVSSVWDRKIDAVMAYPSQLEVIFGGYVGAGSSRTEIDTAMRTYAESIGNGTPVERFWQASA